MENQKILTTLLISLILVSNLTFLILLVQSEEPTKAVKKPLVNVTSVSESAFSGYNITTETTDGGKVMFLFIWQRSVRWNFSGFYGEVIFDTPPILQMSKYEKNGSLEYSITYIPLFLIQYNDTDGNGLFNIQTKDEESVAAEVEDSLIDWWKQQDKPYKAYSLAPIFHFRRQYAWGWDVSSLTYENMTVDGTIVPTYSWNISARVPSFPWLREFRLGWERQLPETTTVNVSFGYHIRLLPDGPEVKYDFKVNGITWAKDDNATKLAMMSAILYHSKELPVVTIGVGRYFRFWRTISVLNSVKKFAIADNVTNNINAFISYSPNATVDGVEAEDIIETALHPLFLIPVTTVSVIPEGVYVRGIYPGIVTKHIWKHYLAFSHQLSLPHFDESIEQDPVISIVATLPTVSLSSTPGGLLQIKIITVLAAVSTVAAAVYILMKRR